MSAQDMDRGVGDDAQVDELAEEALRELRQRLMELSGGYVALHRVLAERVAEGIAPLEEPLDRPDDETLPAFVYGFLKPGELSYPQVKEFVIEASTVATHVLGTLLIRDGLPLLAPGERPIGGFLLFPGGDLYGAMRAFEPRKQYRWEIVTTEDGVRANALYGRSPNNGSVRVEESEFSSCDDLVLVDGPRMAMRALRRSYSGSEIDDFFEVQMAYMLLWSVVERVSGLRYGPSLDPEQKIRALGNSAEWSAAVGDMANYIDPQRPPRVFDVRNPRTAYRFDPARPPVQSLRFLYQFRCNLVHRGKGAWQPDSSRLREAAELLMGCVRSIWSAYRLPWRGDDG